MAEELYRNWPWLRNLTGREKGLTPEQEHQNIKSKAAKHLEEAGIKRPKGAPPILPARPNRRSPDLRGSKTPGSSTPASTNAGEGRAMDGADARNPGDGYPVGVVRPMDYPTNPGKVQPNLNPGSGGGGSGGSEPRTTPEGLLSYGRDLSSLNQFTREFTGGYEIRDTATPFQSEALPATAAGLLQLDKPFVPGANPTQKPNVSSTDEPSIPYGTQLPEGTKPFASTTPYKTGGNPSDPQDGTSDKPDRADRIRQVRTARLGRGGSRADFSGDEPDNSSLVSPMYANSKRNEIRDTFLDLSMPSVKASVAANALARYGKDSDGRARFLHNGELVYAKEGMQQQAKNARMMAQDATEFLDIPENTTESTPAYEPDVSGQSDNVQEAVALTAAPTSFSTEFEAAGPNVDPEKFKTDFSRKIGLIK